MQPPRRIRKLFTGDAPTDREGVRALMEKLAKQGNETGPTDVRLIPQMREAVMERVERTSLRTAAREIGMSPSGLKKFLDGNMPYTKTIHRLRRWYLAHAAEAREELTDEEAFAALRVLVHDLPPGMQAQTVEGMLHCMEQSYTRSRRDIPPWIAEMRARYSLPTG
ncbi:hypothetical protein [Longimicrobium sp.]|uniref:hypothetical protein n=1 Tax=Longimicrobium sp. TaxID=2029185 RepID=UPI003B3A0BC6